MRYIGEQGSLAKVRPDMRIVFIRDFDTAEQRLKDRARSCAAGGDRGEKKAA